MKIEHFCTLVTLSAWGKERRIQKFELRCGKTENWVNSKYVVKKYPSIGSYNSLSSGVTSLIVLG
jgi:hypothetical protein